MESPHAKRAMHEMTERELLLVLNEKISKLEASLEDFNKRNRNLELKMVQLETKVSLYAVAISVIVSIVFKLLNIG